MTKLGFEPRVAREVQAAPSTSRTGWCWSPGPRDRARPTRSTRRSPQLNTPDINIMTAEDPVEFNLAGINQVQIKRADRPQLRRRAALVPAAGPEHHPGRRDPRLRDGGDRDQGRAHRPPRALDAAHQRRALDHHPPDEHGHRAVPGRRPRCNLIRAQRLVRRICAQCKDELIDVPAQGAHRHRLHAGGGRTRSQLYKGRGCGNVQQHRLQGPRRPLRGAWRSPTTSATSSWSAPRAIELKRKAAREGMLTLRTSGLDEDQGRHHDDRRGRARDGAVDSERGAQPSMRRRSEAPWQSACTSCSRR